LYGRETEIDTLLTAFDRIVAGGRSELVLVSGYSGIGKSSVVNELHRQLVPPRGLFASGKFDQYKRDIPYATLAQAFQSLIRPLLSKSEAELRTWRNVLREALSIRRGHWANRPNSRIVPPCTVMGYETRTASTATERRAIETIHAGYLFNIASALNRPQGCRLRDMQRCMGAIAPTRSAQPTPPPRTTRKLGLQLWSVALGGIVPGVT
jgi:hypothetical protein